MSTDTEGDLEMTNVFNPFPGLRPFRQEEHFLFFGREEQTVELLGLLGEHRFLAVVGTSGSGKSSLVRAGLVPALHRGTMTKAGSTWEVLVLRPGGSPIYNLAKAFSKADLYEAEDDETIPRLVATLSHSSMGLTNAYQQSNIEPGVNLLVIVDQFEELFRFQQNSLKSRDSAGDFVNLLLQASQQQQFPIFVVITMRSDYLGDCSAFHGLAEAVNKGEYLIPRLKRSQLRAAIDGPVGVGGGRISNRLVQMLLNGVGDNPDQLPVLQHALMRTWDCWHADHNGDEPLDLRHYEAAGTMDTALSQHAGEIYDQLPSDSLRMVAERLFKALTEQGTDRRGIRRPTRFDQLCEIIGATREETSEVIEAFRGPGRTFLMPMHEIQLRDDTVIDISHESLMRVWTLLEQWVEQESQSARIYRRLADTAGLYMEGKAGLYRDPDLRIALTWRETAHPNLEWARRYHEGFDQAMKFLAMSCEAQEREEKVREEARQRELTQAKQLAETERTRAQEQQKSAKRLRWLAGGLSVIALIAAVACGAAVIAFRHANEQSVRATEARESALLQLKRAVGAEVVAAEARDAAVAARDEAELRGYASNLAAAVADMERNDSRSVKRRLAEAPQRLRGWELEYLLNEADRTLARPVSLPPKAEGYEMCLSGDGQLVATRPSGGHNDPVRVYDTRTGAEVAMLPTVFSNGPQMTFSADKRWLAYSHWGTPGVQIYDLSAMRPIVPLSMQHSFYCFLAFDPKAKQAVLVSSQDEKVRVFKLEDWSQVSVVDLEVDQSGGANLRPQGSISPDGDTLVVGAAGSKSPIRVFDLKNNKLLKEIPADSATTHVRFEESGNFLSTVSADGTITEYQVAGWRQVARYRDKPQRRGGLADVKVDGDRLRLSFDENGAVAVFNSKLTRAATLRGNGAAGSSIAVDTDLQQIVSAHRDGVVCRWDLRHPQELQLAPAAVSFSRDGSSAYAGLTSSGSNNGKQVCEVDITSGNILGYLRWYPVTLMHGSMAIQVALSPNGNRVAAATQSGWGHGRFRIFDPWTGVAEFETEADKGDLKCIDWSADGRWLAAGGHVYNEKAGYVHVYDTNTLKQVFLLQDFEGAVNALTFSKDGNQLVTACEDGRLRSWAVPTGELMHTLENPGDAAFNCLVFAPSGDYVVAGASDGAVAVWNPKAGQLIQKIQVHGAAVSCLAFLPDGSRLATAASDRSLKILDPQGWRDLLTLHLEQRATAMRFSPDGKRLALATGYLVFLDTEAESVRAQQRSLARKNDTPANQHVAELLKNLSDPVKARDQILADSNLEDGFRHAVLRRLRRALDESANRSYDPATLNRVIAPLFSKLLLAGSGISRAELSNQLASYFKSDSTLSPLNRQALEEFAVALAGAGGIPTANDLAWPIVLQAGGDLHDYALAYFGMEALVRRSPNEMAFQNTMATALYRLGLYRDAVESATRSEELTPPAQRPSPHNLAVIAMSQHRMGQKESASDTMKQIDEVMKQPQHANDEEAIALTKEAKMVLSTPVDTPWVESAAWETCRSLIAELKVTPANRASWQCSAAQRLAAHGFAEQAMTWIDDVIKTLRPLVEADPKDTALLLQYGLALSEQGTHADAVAALQRLVELNGRDPSSHWNLAKVYRKAGRKEEAVASLETMLKAQPQNIAAWVALGRLQRELGRLEESQKSLKTALRFAPTDPNAKRALQETEEALRPDSEQKQPASDSKKPNA